MLDTINEVSVFEDSCNAPLFADDVVDAFSSKPVVSLAKIDERPPSATVAMLESFSNHSQ